MASLESNEAYDLLRRSIGEEEQLVIRKAELAAYASAILRKKGALGFVHRGFYGGRPHRSDSSRPGLRMTQATMPVQLAGGRDRVALRDHEQEKPVIELIATQDERAVGVRNAAPHDVLVSFENKSLSMPGVARVDGAQLDAVGVLLQTIDNGLDPIPDNRQDTLPHVYYRSNLRDGQIIELRQQTGVAPEPDTIDG